MGTCYNFSFRKEGQQKCSDYPQRKKMLRLFIASTPFSLLLKRPQAQRVTKMANTLSTRHHTLMHLGQFQSMISLRNYLEQKFGTEPDKCHGNKLYSHPMKFPILSPYKYPTISAKLNAHKTPLILALWICIQPVCCYASFSHVPS